MSVQLSTAVPWGRSFEEYVAMFALREADLNKRILACADGPASFNAVMRRLGRRVVSTDPLYVYAAADIRARIEDAKDVIAENTRLNADAYVWDAITPVDSLVETRMNSMTAFLGDYEFGRSEKRYLPHELPDLPFVDAEFDIVLCSHFLFTYSEQYSLEFHLLCLNEMVRVGREARVFPILDMNGQPSRHLEPAIEVLRAQGLDADTVAVPYEFQRGGNAMLHLR